MAALSGSPPEWRWPPDQKYLGQANKGSRRWSAHLRAFSFFRFFIFLTLIKFWLYPFFCVKKSYTNSIILLFVFVWGFSWKLESELLESHTAVWPKVAEETKVMMWFYNFRHQNPNQVHCASLNALELTSSNITWCNNAGHQRRHNGTNLLSLHLNQLNSYVRDLRLCAFDNFDKQID